MRGSYGKRDFVATQLLNGFNLRIQNEGRRRLTNLALLSMLIKRRENERRRIQMPKLLR